jgi:hypothetical protein
LRNCKISPNVGIVPESFSQGKIQGDFVFTHQYGFNIVKSRDVMDFRVVKYIQGALVSHFNDDEIRLVKSRRHLCEVKEIILGVVRK